MEDGLLELVSKELNHLAAILHVYAGSLESADGTSFPHSFCDFQFKLLLQQFGIELFQ